MVRYIIWNGHHKNKIGRLTRAGSLTSRLAKIHMVWVKLYVVSRLKFQPESMLDSFLEDHDQGALSRIRLQN